MAKILDFTKQKKEYLTVKLNDENKTVLLVGTPTKAILDEFIAINEMISEDEGAGAEAINELYEVCAKVLSFNKAGIKITAEYLAEFFDLEDITVLLQGYTEFMSSITNAKN